MSDTQRRAIAGGEIGANGEWYPGGAFIATTDHSKGCASAKQALTTQTSEQAARIMEYNKRLAAWRADRADKFAAQCDRFMVCPFGRNQADWLRDVENGNAGFEASLAFELKTYGTLTLRQASFFTKAVLGRQTKRNADAWDDLFYAVQERFDDAAHQQRR